MSEQGVGEGVWRNLSLPLELPGLLLLSDDTAIAWKPFAPGIDICRLYRLPTGQSAALLRYEPGARLRRHRHAALEHVLVLRGSQSDENGVHRQGTLLVHPPGTSHTVYSVDGCVVLALWEQPVIFEEPASDVMTRPLERL